MNEWLNENTAAILHVNKSVNALLSMITVGHDQKRSQFRWVGHLCGGGVVIGSPVSTASSLQHEVKSLAGSSGFTQAAHLPRPRPPQL